MFFEFESLISQSDSTILFIVQERCRNTDFGPFSA